MYRPYVQPDLRLQPSVTRTVISSPSEWENAELLAADPEGRFVLSITTDGAEAAKLNQLNLATGSLTELANSSSIPDLAYAREIMFLDSVEVGRLLTIRTGGLYTYCLIDKENDGIFETIDSLPVLEYEEKYPWHSMTKQP